MRLWKILGVTVMGLAVAAAAAAWAPGVSGQEPAAKSQAGQKAEQADKKVEQKIDGSPQVLAFNELLGQAGGSRLGVQIRDVAKEDVAKMKLQSESGVVIEEVTDESAAAKAGLKAGDVVVQFDGETVRSASQFARLVRETPVGRGVKLSVMRGGARVEIAATTEAQAARMSWTPGAGVRVDADRIRERVDRLREEMERSGRDRELRFRVAPETPGGNFQWFGDGPLAMVMGRGRLGVTIQDLTPELAEYFGVKDGVLVSSVAKDSPAAKAGIKAGDIITTVDGKTIEDSGDVIEQVSGKEGEVTVGLMRDKKAMSLKATIEKSETPRPRIVARGRIL